MSWRWVGLAAILAVGALAVCPRRRPNTGTPATVLAWACIGGGRRSDFAIAAGRGGTVFRRANALTGPRARTLTAAP